MQKIISKSLSFLLSFAVVLGIFSFLQINAETTADYELVTLDGATYKVYSDHAEVSGVDSELTEVVIAGSVNGVPVNDYRTAPSFIFNAAKLESIGVSPNNTTFRSVDGVFMKYEVTKDENGNDVYHDTLLLYPPAASGTYFVPDSVEDIAIDAFKNAKSDVVYIPHYHSKWTVIDNDVYEFTATTTDKGITQKKVGKTPIFKGEDYGVKFTQVGLVAGMPGSYEYITAYGVTYQFSSDEVVIMEFDPEATEIFIAGNVSGRRVSGFYYGAVTEAAKLAKINVSPENKFYRSVDGVLMDYEITKDENGEDVYQDEIIIYPPAAPKSYLIPLTVEDIAINAFKYTTGVQVRIPEDHPKWVAHNNVVMEYTTETIINDNGEEEVVKVFNDTLKFVGDDYGVEFVTAYSGIPTYDLFTAPLLRGDVNCDNNVNTADIMTMLQIWKTNAVRNISEYQKMIDIAANDTAYTTSQNAYQSIANADVYEVVGEREINIFDISALLSYYFKKTELPPTVLSYNS